MARHILATDKIVNVSPAKGKKFTLKELQGFVGGYIERIPLTGRTVAFCNEEGRINSLPFNRMASLEFNQVLYGDVIVCGKGEA